MKRILLATAAFAVVASPAFAGDLLSPPPPPAYAGPAAAPGPAAIAAPAPKAAAAVDWTGAYVGGLVQYSTGNMTGNDAGFTLLQQSLKPDIDGFMGGVLTGFNYQYNSWVFGVTGDISGGSVKGSRSDAQPMGLSQANAFFGTNAFTGPANVAARLEVDNNWLATVRGRIGFPWYDSPFLIYGTGGVAFGDVSMRVSANGTDGNVAVPFGASEAKTLVGYAVGAGAEWMLDRNFSLGAEYLYVDLQKDTFFADKISGGGIDAGYQTHNFRLNLNYHF
jgi:outer membrane immunogenic protein